MRFFMFLIVFLIASVSSSGLARDLQPKAAAPGDGEGIEESLYAQDDFNEIDGDAPPPAPPPEEPEEEVEPAAPKGTPEDGQPGEDEIEEAPTKTEKLERKLKSKKTKKSKKRATAKRRRPKPSAEETTTTEEQETPPSEEKEPEQEKGSFDPFSSVDGTEEPEEEPATSAPPPMDAGQEEEDENNPFERDFARRLVLSPKSIAGAVTLSLLPGLGFGNFYAADYYTGYFVLCLEVLGLAVAGSGFGLTMSDPSAYFNDAYFSQGEALFYSGLVLYLGTKVFGLISAVEAVQTYNERFKMKVRRLNEVTSVEPILAPVVLDDRPYLLLGARF